VFWRTRQNKVPPHPFRVQYIESYGTRINGGRTFESKPDPPILDSWPRLLPKHTWVPETTDNEFIQSLIIQSTAGMSIVLNLVPPEKLSTTIAEIVRKQLRINN
jgi:hypothetical protein